MIPEDLIHELNALDLSASEDLLFRPSGQKAWLSRTFHEIPRYLFRVFTLKSQGETTAAWTRSMAAKEAVPKSKLDIFAQDDKCVARVLCRHLWWRKGPDDNFVSWTSSLLFALVYIFHLHASLRDGSEFHDIFLCVIDTTKFAAGTFLRDMDLIKAYGPNDADLRELEKIRLKDFYFGEYLSQGALKFQDKCKIVPASEMIEHGLLTLRPDFESFATWSTEKRPPWAYPTLLLRTNGRNIDEEKLLALIEVAELFGPRWKLPMAANLASCLGASEDIVRSFVGLHWTGPSSLTPT
ncbi:hypothetical protein N0V90_013520 [Kalmusia sp. IMI 367209]|nr:hypothetical protein N0V90_013520 [Kalmusia sp. IMI 367209]